MTVIVNQPRYTPVGVAPFSLIKPDAPADQPNATDLLNSELQAISNAFKALSSMPAGTGVTTHGRNVLVDLSGLINTDTSVTIVLPTAPTIGDPPSIIQVVESGYHTAPGKFEAAAVITTINGTPINGVVPDNDEFTNLICLYNPGDRAVCVYAGPGVGWQIYLTISTVSNPIGFSFPWSGAFPGPMQDSILAYATAGLDLGAITQIGQWFTMTNSAVGTVTLGDSTYTFNGIAGPYIFSDRYVKHRFTLTGVNTFVVSS